MHGIATSSVDAVAFERDVENTLLLSGIPAMVELGAWKSTGSVVGDLWTLARRNVEIADDLLPRFRAWVADLHPSEPALILGHSFGSILARRLVAERATELRGRLCTLLTLGSPATHPLLSLGLPAQTVYGIGFSCVSIVNPDDAVAAWRRSYKRLSGWRTEVIDFATSKPDPSRAHSSLVAALEHDPISYLRHRSTIREISRAAGIDPDAALVRSRASRGTLFFVTKTPASH